MLIVTDNKLKAMDYPVGETIAFNLPIINHYTSIIKRLTEKQHKEKTIILYCRGSSGAIIAGIIASQLTEKKVIVAHVKKDGESSHAGKPTYSEENTFSVIVDDIICSGDTIGEIVSKINHIRFDLLIISGGVSRYVINGFINHNRIKKMYCKNIYGL